MESAKAAAEAKKVAEAAQTALAKAREASAAQARKNRRVTFDNNVVIIARVERSPNVESDPAKKFREYAELFEVAIGERPKPKSIKQDPISTKIYESSIGHGQLFADMNVEIYNPISSSSLTKTTLKVIGIMLLLGGIVALASGFGHGNIIQGFEVIGEKIGEGLNIAGKHISENAGAYGAGGIVGSGVLGVLLGYRVYKSIKIGISEEEREVSQPVPSAIRLNLKAIQASLVATVHPATFGPQQPIGPYVTESRHPASF